MRRRKKTLTPTKQRLNERKRKIRAGLPKRRGRLLFPGERPWNYKARLLKRQAKQDKRLGVR